MEGKISNPDWGILPDHEVDVRELDARDAWKNAELFELLKQDVFNNYVKEHIQQHKALFLELADGDGASTERYPDFENFFQKLQTKLSKDDVRRWLRYAIRDQISDTRGKAYPGNRALGDFQEDGQLQEAVRRLLLSVGLDIEKVQAYQGVLKSQTETPVEGQQGAKR